MGVSPVHHPSLETLRIFHDKPFIQRAWGSPMTLETLRPCLVVKAVPILKKYGVCL